MACSCNSVFLMDRIANSDFIALAKILDVAPDKANSSQHTIEIEILDLFKGENISSLNIYSALNSSCAFYTPPNSTWLIFASKNKNGTLGFGYCSGAERLDRKFNSKKYPNAEKNHKKSIERQIGILEYLRKEQIDPHNEFRLRNSFSNSCLKAFKGIETNNDEFALYELTVKRDLTIKKVRTIKDFGAEKLNLGLLECIEEDLVIYNRNKENGIKHKTKIIIGLHYYPPEKEHKSFIGRLYTH